MKSLCRLQQHISYLFCLFVESRLGYDVSLSMLLPVRRVCQLKLTKA
jgi:hypothetical protein